MFRALLSQRIQKLILQVDTNCLHCYGKIVCVLECLTDQIPSYQVACLFRTKYIFAPFCDVVFPRRMILVWVPERSVNMEIPTLW